MYLSYIFLLRWFGKDNILFLEYFSVPGEWIDIICVSFLYISSPCKIDLLILLGGLYLDCEYFSAPGEWINIICTHHVRYRFVVLCR